MYTAGRDPENFSHPSEFAPDRWLRAGNETDYKVYKPHGTLPFALGGRSCIGKKVAAYQIHCLITKVTRVPFKCGGRGARVWGETWNRYVFCLQILNNFSLESCNEGELNLKSQMIGIPDEKILISFRNLMSWGGRRGEQKKATEDGNNGAGEMRGRVREGKTRNGEKKMKRLSNERNLLHIVNLKLITVNKNHLMNKFKA